MNYKLEFPLSPELEKYRDRIEATITPYIEIKIQNNDSVNWWQSKFGGLPYLPKGFDYPKTPDGKYLIVVQASESVTRQATRILRQFEPENIQGYGDPTEYNN